MKAPRGWNDVRPMSGESKEVLTEGGHGCVITFAECITENWGSGDEEKLRLEIDIKEGTSLDGYYARQMEKKMKYGNPSWPGVVKQGTTTKDGSVSPFYKGLITAIEDSNPGYSFERSGFDEKTLIGKKVGFVFRDEPFVSSSSGEVVHYIKPAWACKYDDWREQPIPTPKKVRGQKAESVSTVDYSQMTESNDVDLPF